MVAENPALLSDTEEDKAKRKKEANLKKHRKYNASPKGKLRNTLREQRPERRYYKFKYNLNKRISDRGKRIEELERILYEEKNNSRVRA